MSGLYHPDPFNRYISWQSIIIAPQLGQHLTTLHPYSGMLTTFTEIDSVFDSLCSPAHFITSRQLLKLSMSSLFLAKL
jgi:hypothetical protein